MELPEVPRVTLVGSTLQVSPVAGEAATVNATAPAKLSRLVTVIVETPEVPALTVTLVGLAVTVKSWTLYAIVALWDRLPLVPVTVTV